MATEAASRAGAGDGRDGHGRLPADSKLARLLETETRLERRIAEARREAEALVEAARVDAEERRRQVESRLDGHARTLQREILDETGREIEAIRERAARRARDYRGAGSDTVEGLAALVVERLVAGGDAP